MYNRTWCMNGRTNKRINICIYNVCPCNNFNTDARLARVIVQVQMYLEMRNSYNVNVL